MHCAKKWKKIIEWERIKISSRRSELPREHSCKDGHNKGQKWQDPNRSRRDGKNTQKNCTKKVLNDPDNHDGVVTHLETDILECEVKWALGSIPKSKASRGDGFPAELF